MFYAFLRINAKNGKRVRFPVGSPSFIGISQKACKFRTLSEHRCTKLPTEWPVLAKRGGSIVRIYKRANQKGDRDYDEFKAWFSIEPNKPTTLVQFNAA
jgi:hypothetical protein